MSEHLQLLDSEVTLHSPFSTNGRAHKPATAGTLADEYWHARESGMSPEEIHMREQALEDLKQAKQAGVMQEVLAATKRCMDDDWDAPGNKFERQSLSA